MEIKTAKDEMDCSVSGCSGKIKKGEKYLYDLQYGSNMSGYREEYPMYYCKKCAKREIKPYKQLIKKLEG